MYRKPTWERKHPSAGQWIRKTRELSSPVTIVKPTKEQNHDNCNNAPQSQSK